MDEEIFRYNHVDGKYVCISHFVDYAIKGFIKINAEQGRCSYCKRKKKVIPVELLMEPITEAVGFFYEDPAESMSYDSAEGGYIGTTYDIGDVLENLGLEVDNEKLLEDIWNCYDTTGIWCKKDPYQDNEEQFMRFNWERFKEVIKHRCRYVFSLTDQFDDKFLDIKVWQTLNDIINVVKKLDLFTEVLADERFYRCRQHKSKNEITKIEDIASPAIEFAICSNRMSPAGVSMFYGAFKREVAKRETIVNGNLEKPYLTTATFSIKSELFLLDLSRELSIPSAFDIEKLETYFKLKFLRGFVLDISKPIVRDGGEHIDYVPTQVVTEFFRYAFKDRIERELDGIIYPSAKVNKEKVFVLFYDQEDCKKLLNLEKLNTRKII